MINSLAIGKLVYNRVSDLVGNRCYPIVAENGSNFPFIVYSRDSVEPSFCKDGHYEDEVTVTIKVVHATYNGSVELAQSVRERMTFNNLTYEGCTYTSELVNADESYEGEVYVQTLLFKTNINN